MSKRTFEVDDADCFFSDEEIEKLSKLLDDLEADAYYPFKHHSGGFASAEVFNYDPEYIDVELKFGIQDGDSSVVYTEQLQIERETMTVIN